jgi:hypothetical protein
MEQPVCRFSLDHDLAPFRAFSKQSGSFMPLGWIAISLHFTPMMGASLLVECKLLRPFHAWQHPDIFLLIEHRSKTSKNHG